MIFVTLGSQKFQFNRLLKELDKLAAEGKIPDEIFAQTGYSDYAPSHFAYSRFLDGDQFSSRLEQAEIVIAHAGTGAIVSALKRGCKVIVVPRKKQFGEHVDDHQLQIAECFGSAGLVLDCDDCSELAEYINKIRDMSFPPFKSNNAVYIKYLTDYIGSL